MTQTQASTQESRGGRGGQSGQGGQEARSGQGAGTAGAAGAGWPEIVSDPVEVILACLRLSDKARRYGLLSLEDDLDELPGMAFRLMIQEVVDGTPPEMISQLMQSHMEELRARREEELRRELLSLRLVRAGVLAIQRGDSPNLVRTILAAHIHPEDKARLSGVPRERWVSPPPPQPSAGPPAPGWTEEDVAQLTLDHVLKLSHRDLVRVVRQIDSSDLAIALRGASEEVQGRFLQSMSERAAAAVRDDMELMGPQQVTVIQEAQGRIVQIMRGLAQSHRIGGRPR